MQRRFFLLGLFSLSVFGIAYGLQSRLLKKTVKGNDLPVKVKKVVSLAPSLTETLFALGLGHLLIGVSDYCQLPADYEGKLPRLGTGETFSLEAVLHLNPDLILGVDLPEIPGLPFFRFSCSSLQDVLDNFKQVAFLCGYAEKGVEFYSKSLELIEETKKKYQNAPTQKVLISIFRSEGNAGKIGEMTIAGNEKYYTELLHILNAENVYTGPLVYPMIGEEGLQNMDPHVIIDLISPEQEPYISVADWQSIPISAVINKRVYKIGSEGFVPGPRFIQFLSSLAFCLYGDTYA